MRTKLGYLRYYWTSADIRVVRWVADKLMQQMFVDQCLPEMDCLKKVFKHGTTRRIHFSQTLPHSDS